MNNPLIKRDALEGFVAKGISWTSQSLISIDISGSWGCFSKGSLKKITILHVPSATLDAICASPPNGPESKGVTSNPALATFFPVVPVEINSISFLLKVHRLVCGYWPKKDIH